MDALADLLCDEDSVPELCGSVLFLLCGFDSAQLNMTLLLLHHIEHFDCSKLLHGIRGCNQKMLVKITKDWE